MREEDIEYHLQKARPSGSARMSFIKIHNSTDNCKTVHKDMNLYFFSYCGYLHKFVNGKTVVGKEDVIRMKENMKEEKGREE